MPERFSTPVRSNPEGITAAPGYPHPVERFVRLIVAGGASLVAGLWITALAEGWTGSWLVGVALVLAGTLGLAAGTTSELRF